MRPMTFVAVLALGFASLTTQPASAQQELRLDSSTPLQTVSSLQTGVEADVPPGICSGVAMGSSQNFYAVTSTDVHTQSAKEDWYNADMFQTWGQINEQNRYRAQVQFDLSNVTGSDIERATLVLTTNDDVTGNVIVERLTQSAPPLYSATVGQGEVTTEIDGPNRYAWNVTAMVRQWVINGADNYGFRLRPDNDTNAAHIRFNWSGDCAEGPVLLIVTN